MKNNFTMIKRMCFVFAFCWLGIFSTNGQVTDVVTGLNQPTGVAIKGNTLYYVEIGSGKLFQIDLIQTNPTPVELLSGLSTPQTLTFNGDDLLITEEATNKISKVDLTQSSLTSELVISTGSGGPTGIALDGDNLYISQFFGDNVFVTDLSQANPTLTELVSNVNSAGFVAKYGNELFISQFLDNKISKIDLTQTNPTPVDVVTGLGGPAGLLIDGNFLYVAEINGNKISRIDLTESSPTTTDVVTGLNAPRFFAFNGIDLYISEFGANKISKLSLGQAVFSGTTVCANSMSENIGGASPTGGIYSGANVTDNGDGVTFTFDAATAGIGMHTVTYTIGGQSTTAIVEVVASPTAIAVENTSITCNGAADGSVQAGLATSYLWSNGATTQVAGGVAAGVTYTVTVTNAAGCTATASVTLSEPDVLTSTATVDANTCMGSTDGAITASQTGGTAGYTYSWSNGATTASASSLAGGTYTATVTDANGCTATSSAMVTEFALPIVTTSVPDTAFAMNGVPPANINGGGTPVGGVYTDAYGEVDDDGNGMTFSFNAMAIMNGLGLFNTIIYTYTDANGCVNTSAENIFLFDATVAVEDVKELGIEIFPNPTAGIINIKGAAFDRIEVIDMNGKILLIESTPTNTLNISAFPSGIYFLRINVGDQVATQRIVKE